ncbi:hypothetical protein D918_06342 [Trichuris suis]|nr:hypothetical protein D918_06342 [Trichuris suis]
MNDESLLGALASRSDPSALMELEQRVLALQCNYKQRQSDLVEQFQRSQQELAASHLAESQNLLEEFLKERSAAHAPVLRHSSLPTMSPLPRASSIETAASSGSPAGHSPCTISDRTKEKLKSSGASVLLSISGNFLFVLILWRFADSLFGTIKKMNFSDGAVLKRERGRNALNEW